MAIEPNRTRLKFTGEEIGGVIAGFVIGWEAALWATDRNFFVPYPVLVILLFIGVSIVISAQLKRAESPKEKHDQP